MVIDYEAAWSELQELVASKSQHGRDGLLRSMAEVAGRHRVAGGELSRLLRLYSVEVERARAISSDTIPDKDADLAAGLASAGDCGLPGHHDEGSHDGSSSSRTGAGAHNGRVAAGQR